MGNISQIQKNRFFLHDPLSSYPSPLPGQLHVPDDIKLQISWIWIGGWRVGVEIENKANNSFSWRLAELGNILIVRALSEVSQ